MLSNSAPPADPLWSCLLSAAAISIVVVSASHAQSGADGQDKRIELPRLDADIVVDGVLDEAAWAEATNVTDLHQLNPVEFAPPSQPTEIRIFFDENALYVSARLWDEDAEHITARVLRQGEGQRDEDRFAVILDPYLDRTKCSFAGRARGRCSSRASKSISRRMVSRQS